MHKINGTVYVCVFCGSAEIGQSFSGDVQIKHGHPGVMGIDVDFCAGCGRGNTHERIPIEKARGLPEFDENYEPPKPAVVADCQQCNEFGESRPAPFYKSGVSLCAGCAGVDEDDF